MNIAQIRGNGNVAPDHQLFGIEVEVERCRRYDIELLDPWQAVADGSLRNHGMEFITPPVREAKAMSMFTSLWGQMARYKWVANARTGIHIHMDMQRLTLAQFKKFMVAYLCMEPILFELCGPDREENIYCVPWYRAATDMDALKSFLDGGGMRAVRRTTKYSALYLEPLYRFGTVEFRGCPTFGTSAEMVRFFGLLNGIRIQASRMQNAEAVLDLFENNTMEAIYRFAGRAIGERDHVDLLERCDSIGVATSLVRTRSRNEDWQFPNLVEREPTPEQRAYAQTRGNRRGAPTYRVEGGRLGGDNGAIEEIIRGQDRANRDRERNNRLRRDRERIRGIIPEQARVDINVFDDIG